MDATAEQSFNIPPSMKNIAKLFFTEPL